MHHLLGLPRELRDEIIEDALELPTPTFDAALANRSKDGIHLIRLSKPPKYPTTACALELVNHHLLDETRSAINRISSDLPNYSLDVIIASGFDEIWPTWTCVPKLCERINRVDVTVRLFDTDRAASGPNAHLPKLDLQCPRRIFGALSDRRLLTRPDGRPSRVLATAFYWMLKHFLDHGPSSETLPPFRRVSVKEICLNFVEPETGQNCQERSAAAIETSIMEHLRLLLTMGDWTACYGGLLFEGVGSITSSVEGKLTTKIDLGDWLYQKSSDPENHLSWRFPDINKLIRDEVVAELTSYYGFLAGLHIPESAILYPPPGGWPTITKESFASCGKTNAVIDLLRHIPYIEEQPLDNYNQRYAIYEGCCAVDYRHPKFAGENGRGHFYDAEFPMNEPANEEVARCRPAPTPHVVVLGNLFRERNGNFFTVDTCKGTATIHHWQAGHGLTYPVKPFFEMLKERYRSMSVGKRLDLLSRTTMGRSMQGFPSTSSKNINNMLTEFKIL
ncbi:hypothetical protein SLS58_001879 [Diplodia intermedia]|uniref:Uncharacterized protein n=1 Tax=Diplodia intermedia TaxID=856260 RepID=A0ABR3U042_9PEZI